MTAASLRYAGNLSLIRVDSSVFTETRLIKSSYDAFQVRRVSFGNHFSTDTLLHEPGSLLIQVKR